ncbi:Negative regulator of mitotic exit, partial [Tulasnella sp. 417]
MSRSTSAAQEEAMPTKVESAASELGVPTDYAGANSKPGLDVSQASTVIPYALTWAEHEMELRPVKPLKSSDHPEMTPKVFNRWGHSFTAIPNSSGEFIIFGGIYEEKKSWTNDVVLLSTNDMSLTALETNGAKPDIRADHGAVISGRVLIVFGGSSVESHLHFLNLDTREWSKLRPPAPYPGPRFGHSFIMVDNTIWLYGGLLTNSLPVSDDMWCIDLAAGIGYARWRQVPKKDPWPEVRGFHSTVYYDGCLYMFAGEALGTGEQFVHYNDLWRFEIRTETWARVQYDGLVPQPRASLSATVIGENMFIFGGSILQAGTKNKVSRADHAFVFNFRGIWSYRIMVGSSGVE